MKTKPRVFTFGFFSRSAYVSLADYEKLERAYNAQCGRVKALTARASACAAQARRLDGILQDTMIVTKR